MNKYDKRNAKKKITNYNIMMPITISDKKQLIKNNVQSIQNNNNKSSAMM